MTKILTKHQKKIEAQREAKKYIKVVLEPKMLNDIEVIVEDDKTPPKHFIEGDTSIVFKAIKKRVKK